METKQAAFLVVVEITKAKSTVKIYDGAQELNIDEPLAEGTGSHWRGAMGQALEQINIKTGEEDESK